RAVAELRNDAGRSGPLGLEPERLQLLLDVRRSLMLLEGQLGIGMQMPAPLHCLRQALVREQARPFSERAHAVTGDASASRRANHVSRWRAGSTCRFSMCRRFSRFEVSAIKATSAFSSIPTADW